MNDFNHGESKTNELEEQEDILNEIFVDKNEPADKRIVVSILKDILTIDEEGIISYLENYDKLTNMKKALIYLCAKKAMVLRGLIEPDQESAGPAEVSNKAIVSESNAKNALCTHYKKVLVKVSGGYIIPNYNLKKVKELILEDG